MEPDEELLEKHKKTVKKFWENIENYLVMPVPPYIKKLFEYSNLDNAKLLKGVPFEKVLGLQKVWNSAGYKLQAQSSGHISDYYKEPYVQDEESYFLPGIESMLETIYKLVQSRPDSYWEYACDSEDLNKVISALNKWSVDYEHVNESKKIKLQKSTFLNMLITALAKNSEAKTKAGYRYDDSMKLIAGYIYVLGGRILYQNLSSNLPLPSMSTANRILHETVEPVIQGECRIKELVKFLQKYDPVSNSEQNLGHRVWLSEDATRMVPKVQYDSMNNQLVGLVQPIDSATGFPKVDSFKANSLAEMQKHFEKNDVASYLYCYMIQPLKAGAPSFCLSMFGTDSSFTTDDTIKRLDYITDLLKKNGITVLGTSGDGDPRILKAMRIKSRLGQNTQQRHEQIDSNSDDGGEVTLQSNLRIDGFHADYFPILLCVQDPVHLATKFKTRLFKISITLPMGNYIVSASHLRFLLENFTKDKHLLTSRHLDGKDKMNFESVIKISSKLVIDLLKRAVPGSEASQEYLKVINLIIYSFLSTELDNSMRIYCIWYCVFFVRLWRTWLLKNHEYYSITNNFLSLNTYMCLEINAHGLLSAVLKTFEDESLQKHILPWMFGSQPCEGFFRTCRSLSTVFCTAINSSVLEVMRKTQRMEFLSEVMAHDFEQETINFTRNTFMNASFEKLNDKDVYIEPEVKGNDIFKQKLNADLINKILDIARRNAFANIVKLGVESLTLADANELTVNPVEIEDTYLFDDQEKDEQEELIEPPQVESDNVVEHIEEVGNVEDFQDLNLRDYSSTKSDLKKNDPFLNIKEKDGTIKTVRKSSICYLLSQNNEKLSSDRTVRVQATTKLNKQYERRNINDVLTFESIQVLDWCLFENKDTKKCLIGFVLGFAYMNEKKWKSIQFSKNVAKVKVNDEQDDVEKKKVGVLCNWYGFFDKKNKKALIPAKMNSHGYYEIDSYKCNIPTPQFENNKMYVSDRIYNKIKKNVMHR